MIDSFYPFPPLVGQTLTVNIPFHCVRAAKCWNMPTRRPTSSPSIRTVVVVPCRGVRPGCQLVLSAFPFSEQGAGADGPVEVAAH